MRFAALSDSAGDAALGGTSSLTPADLKHAALLTAPAVMQVRRHQLVDA